MATILRPWVFHLFILLLFHTPRCQSNSNQNIQTFFPLSILPPPPSNNTPAVPPPPPPPPPNSNPLPAQPPLTNSSSSSSSSSKSDVAKAVVATAVSTAVVTALAFLLVRRYVSSRKKLRKDGDGNHVNSGGSGRPRSSAAVHHSDQIVGDDFKDLIVDENGLDVVYWRNLEAKNDDYDRRKHGPIQEVPLLRGKSSASHLIADPESEPEPERQSSNITLPPPASPPPPPVPAGFNKKTSSPAPPAPPPPLKRGSSSPPPGSSQQVKLKPLHWDKVNMANTDHSMVWDKINDGGSFK